MRYIHFGKMRIALFLGSLYSACALNVEDVDTANWMGDLRPIIGDKRFGDLVIPATHDSGTCGINEDSHLVDRNFLFELADIVTPDVVVNWSLTHDGPLIDQLNSGYRAFDLRIADVEIFNDTFRWWHGLTGDEIFEDLEDIRDFVIEHPEEVLYLEFVSFRAPSLVAGGGTRDIPPRRKDELSDILLEYLGDVLVPYGSVSTNPTINEVLATGRNVIADMSDSYISGKSDLFWPRTLHSGYSGRTNPEDIFNERSFKLAQFKEEYADRITRVTAVVTPDEKVITGAMIRVYWDNPILKEILEILAPGVAALEADLMSFEGVYLDLFNLAIGTNTGGMYVRNTDNYTNGASVNYMGTDDQFEYWFSRPDTYKPNLIGVDAYKDSNLVDAAIRANAGVIPRQASVSFQGNSRDGFYYWEEFQAIGGAEGNTCENIEVRIIVIDGDEKILQHNEDGKWTVNFHDGEYPPDAEVVIEVNIRELGWVELHADSIQELIDSGRDLFIRGSMTDFDEGFAYVSYLYDLYGADCVTPPDGDYIELITW